MAGLRLEWAQFGDFDSFSIYRSNAPMDVAALPIPIATGLATMYYVDTAVVEGATYYYRAQVWRDGETKLSDEFEVFVVAPDPYFANVVALMHFNNNINDEAGRVWAGIGSLSYGTSVGGFSKSLIKPSGNSYLSSAPINFGSDDLTIEFMVNVAEARGGSESYAWVLAQDNITYRDWQFAIDQTNNLYFTDLSSMSAIIQLTVILTTGWHSIALVRHGSQFKLFVDGVVVGTAAKSGAIKSTTNLSVGFDSTYVGSSSLINQMFEIDELRITNGIARYTENYTPSVAPFVSS